MNPVPAAADGRPGGLFAWYTPGHSDCLGDRLRLFDNTDGPPLELLRLRADLAASVEFERALRARVTELGDFHDHRYARVCRTDRLPEPGGGLAVVSERTEGPRLSETLALADQNRIRLPAPLVLVQLAGLVDAVAALHARGPSLAHGALGPERLVVEPEGRLRVTEYVLGSALAGLHLECDRAWRQFGLVLPAHPGAAAFDQRTDVVQIGAIALALVLSRRLAPDDYPARVPGLLLEADRRAGEAGWERAWPRVRPWLARALALDGTPGFASAIEAGEALSPLVGAGPLPLPERAARAALEAGQAGAESEPSILALDNWDRSWGDAGTDGREASGQVDARVETPQAVPGDPAAAAPGLLPVPPDHVTSLRDRLRPPALGRRTLAAIVVLLVLLVAAPGVYVARRGIPAGGTAAPLPPGSASIISDPTGATVTVDGVLRGRTPVSLDLPAGRHVLELASGDRRRTVTLDAKPGQAATLVLELGIAAAETGQLRVTTNPPGARVLVDGQARGTSPLLVTNLAPGEHDVRADSRGRSARQTVVVEAGATASLLLPLPGSEAPAPGWLSIASPEELHVYNEGELLGTSRTPRIMLPAGRHELDLVNQDLGVRTSHEVIVPVGRTATLEVDLPTARVDINATPWAEVWVDGARIGETPLARVPVPVGRHVVTFKHPDLGERRVECVVSLKRPTRLGVDLRR